MHIIVTIFQHFYDDFILLQQFISQQLNNKLSQNPKLFMQPSKKLSKSLPPINKKHQSYIQNTFKILGQNNDNTNHIKIDGGIGDYRMKLFRKKDKTQYLSRINSIFTQSFTDSILPTGTQNYDLRDKIISIVKNTAIKMDKINREQSIQPEKEQIPVKGEKGCLNNILEEEDYLICSYLPEYQRKKWFQIKDRSVISSPVTQREQSIISNKKSSSVVKPRHKKKHIFAYLQTSNYLTTIK